MQKLTPANIKKIAKTNPRVNMRQLEEWQKMEDELTRLGVDLSPPTRLPANSEIDIRNRWEYS